MTSEPTDGEFDPFFDRIYPELIKRGVRRCNNLHDAEDAAAEIMIEIRRRWFSIENREAYAFRSLLNRIGKAQASPQVRHTVLRPPDELPARSEPDSGIENFAGYQWVNQILGKLPPVQRQVMLLLVSGSKYGEIADELGCSEDTVRQNVRHARLKLRRHLREFDRGSPASGTAPTRKEAG